ncbi:hypothetical protein KJJ36_14225 [Staphylococcus pseudoxylosus]|uniref:hypothetical protein n=1 Tax=Staphylococcus pseudoxylosus TaxID=2282419 RepID=UPI001F2EDF15|nr:hypothetical protein [Staphylococcus pseudoxylosus]MCE5003525.1 hypothetical protein [Staphylococcus pseudoxylosus]
METKMEFEFEVGDLVYIIDDNCLIYNEYYDLEESEYLKLDTVYKVVRIDVEIGDEILYSLVNYQTGKDAGAMVNEWEIEKIEK